MLWNLIQLIKNAAVGDQTQVGTLINDSQCNRLIVTVDFNKPVLIDSAQIVFIKYSDAIQGSTFVHLHKSLYLDLSKFTTTELKKNELTTKTLEITNLRKFIKEYAGVAGRLESAQYNEMFVLFKMLFFTRNSGTFSTPLLTFTGDVVKKLPYAEYETFWIQKSLYRVTAAPRQRFRRFHVARTFLTIAAVLFLVGVLLVLAKWYIEYKKYGRRIKKAYNKIEGVGR